MTPFPISYLQSTDGCLNRTFWEQWFLPCLAQRMWFPDAGGNPFQLFVETEQALLDWLIQAFKVEADGICDAQPLKHPFWWQIWTFLSTVKFADPALLQAVTLEAFDDSGVGPVQAGAQPYTRGDVGGLPGLSTAPVYRLPSYRGCTSAPPSLGGVLAKRWPQNGDVFGPWIMADVLRCLHEVPGYYNYIGQSSGGPDAMTVYPSFGAWGLSLPCTISLYGVVSGNQAAAPVLLASVQYSGPAPWTFTGIPSAWYSFMIIHDVQWDHDLSNIPVIG